MTQPSSHTPFSNVMCIDDSDIDRFILKTFLSREQFAASIICCESPEEALQYLRDNAAKKENLPQVIFLDINMPGMNGYDFMESFHKLDNAVRSYSKIVMLSSSVDIDDIEKAKADPYVQLYLHKPITPQKLQMVVRTLSGK